MIEETKDLVQALNDQFSHAQLQDYRAQLDKFQGGDEF